MIARRGVRHETALADLFGRVLALCVNAGLVSVGVLTVDASRFAAGATDGAIRTSPRPEGKLNTTDPDAKRMKRGPHVHPPTTPGAIRTDGGDVIQLEAMIAAAERELCQVGVTERPGSVLADAGYGSNGHIDALGERGIIPIVAPDRSREKPRKPRLGGPYDCMPAASPASKAARCAPNASGWSSRSSVGSRPTAASTASNAADSRPPGSQWRLITATHNLLHRHGLQPATG